MGKKFFDRMDYVDMDPEDLHYLGYNFPASMVNEGIHSVNPHMFILKKMGTKITLSVGDKIQHKKLGSGTVLSFVRDDAIIKFSDGEKRIDMKSCIEREMVVIIKQENASELPF